MKIAIIGWGSLIWNPGALQIEGDWQDQGPSLKIEFSRVSNDGRLTLVIDLDNGVKIKTYYAQSSRKELEDAIADLRDREGTVIKRIGFVDVKNKLNSKYKYSDQVDVFEEMETWCQQMNFDAAVWTALPPQFKEQTSRDFTVDNAISYLNSLPKSAKSKALEYIHRAPVQVKTPLREKIEMINKK